MKWHQLGFLVAMTIGTLVYRGVIPWWCLGIGATISLLLFFSADAQS